MRPNIGLLIYWLMQLPKRRKLKEQERLRELAKKPSAVEEDDQLEYIDHITEKDSK